MIGIYLHIPFCKKACSYCNFHFSTNTTRMEQMVSAIDIELQDRLQNNHSVIDSIYFGGGTPSLLTIGQINRLIDTIFKFGYVAKEVEITFEMNPDDFNEYYIRQLKETAVNRISIGVQSFFNDDLQFMGRAHDDAAAHKAIKMAQDIGFDQLTIDLIYGTPTMTDENWIKNIDFAASYQIPHLSCYALTVEDKTALSYQIQQGRIAPLSDEKVATHFDLLIKRTAQYGYDQYEISNFCLGDAIAKHNTKYWMGHSYIGVGPSAHSFDGKRRRWNIANNALYIKHIEDGIPFYDDEILSQQDIYNEMVMTGLRTKWGVTKENLDQSPTALKDYFNEQVQKCIEQGFIIKLSDSYILTQKGKIISNHVISDLFYVAE